MDRSASVLVTLVIYNAILIGVGLDRRSARRDSSVPSLPGLLLTSAKIS